MTIYSSGWKLQMNGSGSDQANLRINQFFQKSMKLPEGKVFNNIQRYGNTTAASIPIALDEAIEMNLIGAGSTVLFLGLGSGLTWGAVISRLVG
jgi:3-oxoacyl-[acyl-carrier-protein] synthase-3